jgi:hypothetical protein
MLARIVVLFFASGLLLAAKSGTDWSILQGLPSTVEQTTVFYGEDGKISETRTAFISPSKPAIRIFLLDGEPAPDGGELTQEYFQIASTTIKRSGFGFSQGGLTDDQQSLIDGALQDVWLQGLTKVDRDFLDKLVKEKSDSLGPEGLAQVLDAREKLSITKLIKSGKYVYRAGALTEEATLDSTGLITDFKMTVNGVLREHTTNKVTAYTFPDVADLLAARPASNLYNPKVKHFGIGFKRSGNYWLIDRIIPGSSGASVGLPVNAQIISMNGTDVSTLSYADLMKLCFETDTLNIKVQTAGGVKEFHLEKH